MATPINRGASSGLAAAASSIDALGVLDSVDAPMLVIDRDLAVHYANQAAKTGLPGGTTLLEVFADARFLGRSPGWAQEVANVLDRGEPRHVEFVVPKTSGERPLFFAGRMTRLSHSSSAKAHQVVLRLERRESSEAVDEQIELTQRLTSLGRLAARVAHELNNPLDGILRYVNLALRTLDGSDPERLRSYLVQSRTGLMRMVQIIGDLLEFSRTTDGKFDDVDIQHVIEQAIQDHASVAEDRRVVIAADFQSAGMPSVRGGRLYQVICNLIKNALDAMPTGGRLTITSGVAGAEVVIKVADTGSGLPDSWEQVFEPFFTTKDAGKGTGLGLAICRDFMDAMGGTIDAGNQPGGGAVFTLRLPVARCVASSRSLGERSTQRPSISGGEDA